MYLMQRISHESEVAEKMLEKGYVSIGWGDFRKHDLNLAQKLVDKVQHEKIDKYEFGQWFKVLAKETPMSWLTSRQGYFLYNFLKLDPGSIIIVPKSYVFDIYKVIEKPEVYSEKKSGLSSESDIGFMVKVEPLHTNVSRSDYLDSALSSKLKYRATNLVFSEEDGKKIEELVQNIERKVPAHDFSKTKIAIIEQIHDYITQKINEAQFEKLIKEYMKHIGSKNAKIPAKNERGENESIADVDIKAPFPNLGIVIYVQAKHHNGTSNTHGIKQLLAYENEIDESLKNLVPFKWFITTGELEEDAIDKLIKDEKIKTDGIENIKIVSGKDFAKMLYESGFPLDSKVFENK
ncbi:hypothetical protein ETI10_00405 [Macrococcoides goetzii]|nr:restriction endonuclease [Macrococcus goetzii]TDM41582.1 hypothetical protein ETI10_00405 [Macrococcus goetzii]